MNSDQINRIREYLFSLRTNNRPTLVLSRKLSLINQLANNFQRELELQNEMDDLTSGRTITTIRRRQSRIQDISELISNLNLGRLDIFDSELFREIEREFNEHENQHRFEAESLSNFNEHQIEEDESIFSSNEPVNSQENSFQQIFNCTFERARELASAFEAKESSLSLNRCRTCKEVVLEDFTNVNEDCNRCLKYARNNELNQYTSANNMDPGDQPEELMGLTILEQMLISPVKPFIVAFRLSGGQWGYSGQVINFKQNIGTLVTQLPHAINSFSDVIILRKETDDISSFTEVRVRKNVIFNALSWLLRNNNFYRNNIELNLQNLNQLPEDDSVHGFLPTIYFNDQNGQNNLNNLSNENNLNNQRIDIIQNTGTMNLDLPNMREQVNRLLNTNRDQQEIPVLDFPRLQPGPINEATAGYISLAFPCLFPTGIADLNQGRIKKITKASYFKHLMLYYDGNTMRFAKDERFRFFASNTILRDQALFNGRLFVQKNSAVANRTPEQLQELLIADPSLYRRVISYNSQIRSTSPFWFVRRLELKDMVVQLGPPTMFFTLSAADIQWPELYRVLDPNNMYPEYQNEFLENRRRIKLLNSNPLLVAWFFHHRADFFIREVLFKHFKVKDHWFRMEMQHRGSPHIHGFVWLEDAPNLNNLNNMSEEEITTVVNYFDRLISAKNLYENSEQYELNNRINPCKLKFSDIEGHNMYSNITNSISKHIADYKNLINTIQRHTICSDSCLRNVRNSNLRRCRYKYPKPLVTNSRISRNENGKFELEMERNDSRMNQHVPLFTSIWRANTDFSPIISLDSVIHYLAKYASKEEVGSDQLFEVQNVLNSIRTTNTTTTAMIQSILCRFCGSRDYSAQECMWIILGLPFYQKSRRFIILDLTNDGFVPVENSNDIINNPEELYAQRSNIFSLGPRRGRPSTNQVLIREVERNREQEEESVGELSLFTFFSKYGKPKSNSHTWLRYDKEAILRIKPRLKPSLIRIENEEYCKLQCKLHVPWSFTFEESLNPNNESWIDVYNRYSEIIPNFIDLDIDEPEEDLDLEEEPEFENIHDQDLHDHQIYMREQPDSLELNQAELGLREQDTAFDWFRTFSNYEDPYQLREFISYHKNRNSQDPIIQDIQMPQVNFSRDQQKVLDLLRSQIEFIRTRNINQNFRRSIIVQGKAGSGKSTLIQAIKSTLINELGSNSYCLMAPTGSAAQLIDAQTIHSMLKININKRLSSLSNQTLNNLQQDFSNCNFIIIDEISLVGCTLFRKIDLRCRQIKAVDEPFGGMFLLLFGDIKQLPPVLDRAFYGTGFNNEYANAGQQLFRQIQSSIILPASFRQNENEQIFRELLDRLADGNTTENDWRTLNSRSILNIENANQFSNVIRLYPTCAKANQYNLERMREFSSVYRIKSINNCNEAKRANSREAENLEQVLYLSINSRVMLRKNLWTAAGLVNGAIRTVTDIVVDPNGDEMPVAVMVRFDRYNGPTIDGSVPIVPIESSWQSNAKECKRTQIPLMVSYGITIHKAQGMTLDHVYVDLGDHEYQIGLAYVALSRTRSLINVALDKEYNYDRFKNISESRLMILRKIEERRLESISL